MLCDTLSPLHTIRLSQTAALYYCITAVKLQSYPIRLGKYKNNSFHYSRLQSSKFMYKTERSVVLLILLIPPQPPGPPTPQPPGPPQPQGPPPPTQQQQKELQ